MNEIIGRGTWLDKVAQQLVEREKSLGRKLDLINVESGLGASGIPHVGSLSDAVRAYGIKMALEEIGYKSRLIAYSDDMDGLRKVPHGLPAWLSKYIAKPVSEIPDPFDCHPSYGRHMSCMLTDALDRLGIDYTFQSGAEAYAKGLLRRQIKVILQNASRIGTKIAEWMAQKKFESVLPFFPICEKCGRIYVAQANGYENGMVRYRCSGTELSGHPIEGCGFEGKIDPLSGKGKLSWKGEFAARWSALDIRFEAYGKDIGDSVKLNDWISDDVLKYPHPYHVRYEMFLDKSGKKISKSLGNVFTPQTWLKFGTTESLMMLMFKRITGTRNLSVQDIPTYMDEYDRLEDIYFGKVGVENPAELRKLKGLFEYVNRLKVPSKPWIHVPYRLLAQLASIYLGEDPTDFILKKLLSYGILKGDADDKLKNRIILAASWAKELSLVSKAPVEVTDTEMKAIMEMAAGIKNQHDASILQNQIFEIAQRYDLQPGEFFKILYRILLGAERGPRLGPYLLDIGTDRAAQILLAGSVVKESTK